MELKVSYQIKIAIYHIKSCKELCYLIIIMDTKNQLMAVLNEYKDYIAERFGVKEMALFGSYAREEQGEDSDIDILIDFKEGYKSFDNYMDLKFYLEELLNKKVDLVIKSAVKSNIMPFIVQEVLYI